ncbi:LysR family transcriptional regulator [Neomicrococcus lactis]|uniref:DNA-binding transcriptional LysR family regulator n=1 Tax=Neomicrococcus lactis TaxID=732241 RepID=A0A7W8YD38_9MICC|nr:LysR family transcriptional regulator [Neomicrococcus lactis]MBB5599157.1 DNA-binding transcriptional LysR family regulator [Neomicrococcus lactis]
MINPHQLRILLEVLDAGSFAAAAPRLNLTASAVSQQISSLERASGVKLFERSARAAVPLPAADAMARHARIVLTELESLVAASSAAERSSSHVELRVGIFPSLASYLIPRLMHDDAWLASGIQLQLSVGEPAHSVRGLRSENGLDVALVFQVGQGGLAWPAALKRTWLAEDPFVFVIPEAWGFEANTALSPAQLADMPWIMHHPGASDAVVIANLFASLGMQPRVVAYSDDFNSTLSLVASGLGAALVPKLALTNIPNGTQSINIPEAKLSRSVLSLTNKPPARSARDVHENERASVPSVQNAAAVFVERVSALLAEAPR